MNADKKIPRPDALKKYLGQADSLANDEGELPCVTWMRKNGYTNLYQYMRAHADRFSHFSQETQDSAFHEKAKERHLVLAQKLSQENGGLLPTVTWMIDNRYSGLVSYMSKHPRLFKNFCRETISNKHVKKAEKIAAAEYDGRLPGSTAIIERGGWALYRFIRRNAGLFSHIPGAPASRDSGSVPTDHTTKVITNEHGNSSKCNEPELTIS